MFAQRATATALAGSESAKSVSGWVFFHRGLIDAGSAPQHLTAQPRFRQLTDYGAFTDGLVPWMVARSIRDWRDTRMTGAGELTRRRGSPALLSLLIN